MRILNCAKIPIAVKVRGRKPAIMDGGKVEVVFPPRNLLLPARGTVNVSEEDGAAITKRWGDAGVMEVPEGVDEQEVLQVGLRRRHQTLLDRVQSYRDHVMACRQVGSQPRLPRKAEKAMLREINEIWEEVLKDDPVLAAELPPLPGQADAIAREMAAFGIPPAQQPTVPVQDPFSI